MNQTPKEVQAQPDCAGDGEVRARFKTPGGDRFNGPRMVFEQSCRSRDPLERVVEEDCGVPKNQKPKNRN